MTIESSGRLGLNGCCTGGTNSRNQIATEVGDTARTRASLNDSNLRTLASKPLGLIRFSDFYGKSNRSSITYTFSSTLGCACLNVSSGLAPDRGSVSGTYVSGGTCVTVIVNSGIYVYSNCQCVPALKIHGASSGDFIKLINNGIIMGRGGAGGNASSYCGYNPSAKKGGPALCIQYPVTIDNTNGSAYIAGGGGGGGNGYTGANPYCVGAGGGGGGAGGGEGGNGSAGISYVCNGCVGVFYTTTRVPGGAPGGLGGNGSNGCTSAVCICGPGGHCGVVQNYGGGGGGGGRSGPTYGAGGTSGSRAGKGAGAGGGGGASACGLVGGSGGYTTAGGCGGSNASGGGPSWYATGGGGGGGYGSHGGNGGYNYHQPYPATGGAGGKAVALNGYSITWISGCTTRVFGAVS